eukprot:718287-Pelagomonas_calceolata.AAC.7
MMTLHHDMRCLCTPSRSHLHVHPLQDQNTLVVLDDDDPVPRHEMPEYTQQDAELHLGQQPLGKLGTSRKTANRRWLGASDSERFQPSGARIGPGILIRDAQHFLLNGCSRRWHASGLGHTRVCEQPYAF